MRLPFQGKADFFEVRRIFCVGRNYADHIREMGGDSDRPEPFFFCKPADNLLALGGDLRFPSQTQDLHHEVELAVAMGSAEGGLAPLGYAVALDLTRRDLQAAAKKTGRPWTAAKCFPGAVPCGALARPADFSFHSHLRLWVNDELRQDGELGQMIWKPEEILVALDDLFELRSGDLVLTGTPAGVGPLVPGDRLLAQIDGLPELRLRILSR